jgi:hypothetical protein
MGVAPSYYCYGYCCFILVIVIVILCILLFWCVGMVLLLLLSILYISSPYMFGWVSCDALYIFLPHPPPFLCSWKPTSWSEGLRLRPDRL